MGYTTFDLEIKEPVDGHQRTWADARSGRCGISVLCLYDSDMDQFSLYDDHNLSEGLDYLRNSDLIVGFNSREFDIPCLEGYLGESLGSVPHLDLLQQVWKALGRRQKGYKLDDICQRTLGLGKSGSGLFASDLYAAGRFAELHSYCLQDVNLTSKLFDSILTNGYIIDVNGNPMEVEIGRSLETGIPIRVVERPAEIIRDDNAGSVS